MSAIFDVQNIAIACAAVLFVEAVDQVFKGETLCKAGGDTSCQGVYPIVKEPLIDPSFWRKPEPMCLTFLDPGLCRDDESGINQICLKKLAQE